MKNYLLMAVVQKGEGERVMKAMRESGAKGGTICFARGTASSSILSVLGLGESMKEVIMSLLVEDDLESVLSSCISTRSKKGVAFIMDANMSEDKAMNNEWQLIEVIVEKGYSEDVMAHARKAGASGGTIVNAHGTASEEDAKFFGISIVPEKEILMIVAESDVAEKVVDAIREMECLKKKGMGILFTIPVRNFVSLG
mgnify:FL=1